MERCPFVVTPASEKPDQAQIQQWRKLPDLFLLRSDITEQPAQDSNCGEEHHREILAVEHGWQ